MARLCQMAAVRASRRWAMRAVTPSMVRSPWRSRSSRPFKVWLTDSMSCRTGLSRCWAGCGVRLRYDGAQQPHFAFGRVAVEFVGYVALVGDDQQPGSVGEDAAVAVEHGHQHLALVQLRVGQGPGDVQVGRHKLILNTLLPSPDTPPNSTRTTSPPTARRHRHDSTRNLTGPPSCRIPQDPQDYPRPPCPHRGGSPPRTEHAFVPLLAHTGARPPHTDHFQAMSTKAELLDEHRILSRLPRRARQPSGPPDLRSDVDRQRGHQ